MATAEVQHPVPTAVHDGSCFQEEENREVAVQKDVPATTKVEEAPGAEEEVQVLTNGGARASEEVEKDKGQEEDSEEENPKDHHEDEAAAIATEDAGHDDQCLIQAALAQDVEAKLSIVVQQADAIVVDDDSAVAAAGGADDEKKKPPKEQQEAGERRRREVPRMTAAANKGVVVPIDDGYDDLGDGEAGAPAEKASEATKEEDAVGADNSEKLKEDEAHEE